MIYLTGDLHGNVDFIKLINFHDHKASHLTKKDYLIILGDFGLIWSHDTENTIGEKEKKLIKRLNSWNWTTLFIDGNHENHDRLNSYPEVEMFGSKVGKIADSIFHLKRGHIYNIEEKKFFVFGGGLSVDKEYRIPGISWWPNELPSREEIEFGLDNLNAHQNKVDYILTHESPRRFIPDILGKIDPRLPESAKYNSPVAKFLDIIYEQNSFEKWFCGHYHEDKTIDNLRVMYYNIKSLEDLKNEK